MNDADTDKLIQDGNEVRLMTESKGWGFVKAKLDERILDVQNINNIDLADINSIAAQIAARKMAAELIFAWLKQDVYGFIEQQDANRTALLDKKESGFIGRD